MATLWSRALAALLFSLLAACASQPTPQEAVAAKETAALAPLKARYPDIVTAFNLHGTRLDIAIDANGYIATGDDAVARFKKAASQDWKQAWSGAHPHQHATLTVRLIDFIGRTWATERVRA
ncbi:MAG TPA: hypothetical protein VMF11_05615 [Candidatus Baltobacteraceae bacterium]|nr:hypothetical protein [Candidatus Baltobacteraceae bacterium]